MTNSTQSPSELLEAAFERAEREVANLSRNLDITNADHIALWLDAHIGEGIEHLGWLACRIVEAHEAQISALSKDIIRLRGFIQSIDDDLSTAPATAQPDMDAVDLSKLSHCPDAAKWASAYKATFPDADEGLMLGWFANAMMAMHDHLMQKHEWPSTEGNAAQVEAMREALIATQQMLETIDRTNSTCMSDVRNRIVANRATLKKQG